MNLLIHCSDQIDTARKINSGKFFIIFVAISWDIEGEKWNGGYGDEVEGVDEELNPSSHIHEIQDLPMVSVSNLPKISELFTKAR